MRTITFFTAIMMLGLNVATATNRINFDEPLTFNERGIDFYVFPNGEFDFNTRPDDSNGDYNFRKAGQKVSNRRIPTNYGVIIEQDAFGRVRRVGNTFINYDFNDRVSRIGTVYMKYNRFGLTQIGGMSITYNRFGDITDTFGSIKSRRSGFTSNYYGPTQSYAYSNSNYYENNNDNNYYFYRTDGTRELIKEKK